MILITVIHFLGYVSIIASVLMIDLANFIGYSQQGAAQRDDPTELNKQYFYKVVRHPIYASFLVTFWAVPIMTYGRLFWATLMSIWMITAALKFEEPDLVRDLGPKYVEYTNTVPAFCPIPVTGCFYATKRSTGKGSAKEPMVYQGGES